MIPSLLFACNDIYTSQDILLFEIELLKGYIHHLPNILPPYDVQSLLLFNLAIEETSKTQILDCLNVITIIYFTEECTLIDLFPLSITLIVLSMELTQNNNSIPKLFALLNKMNPNFMIAFSLSFCLLRTSLRKKILLLSLYPNQTDNKILQDETFVDLFKSLM